MWKVMNMNTVRIKKTRHIYEGLVCVTRVARLYVRLLFSSLGRPWI